jgi:hypothetical protein
MHISPSHLSISRSISCAEARAMHEIAEAKTASKRCISRGDLSWPPSLERERFAGRAPEPLDIE